MPMTGPAIEQVVRLALVLHPAAVNEPVLVQRSEPLLAAQLFHGSPETASMIAQTSADPSKRLLEPRYNSVPRPNHKGIKSSFSKLQEFGHAQSPERFPVVNL